MPNFFELLGKLIMPYDPMVRTAKKCQKPPPLPKENSQTKEKE